MWLRSETGIASLGDWELTMMVPRFRIAWLMVAVAIAAVDFAATRAVLSDLYDGARDTALLLLLGALPMANVLAVGMLIAYPRPTSRPFLLGFEIFGALALALYIVLVRFQRHALILYIIYFNGPILFARLVPSVVEFAIEFFVALVMLNLPQAALALSPASSSAD
jgi:hypothetical protein